MISALILADDDVEALGVTLAALVPAVARGTLKDAVVIDRSLGEDVRTVAEAAGTALVAAHGEPDPWARGADAARAPWMLLLSAGDVPDAGWTETVEQFLLAAGSSGAAAPRGAALKRDTLNLREALSGLLAVRRKPGPGMLLARPQVREGRLPGRWRMDRLNARVRRRDPS